MSTRANPMAGRYFNDPGIAAAVSNLAGAFAPPSAQEYLLAEQVKSERTSGAALADLYAQAGTDPDKLAYVANLYDPTQGLEAMRGGLANERYNTDTVAATSRTNNAADNDRAMREALLTGAMNPAGRQDMDAELLGAILPGINAPGISAAGPVAPTDAQVRGDMIAGARDDGLISNDDIYAMTMGDVPTQQIVTDAGNRLTFGPLAARDGAEPYNPTGGQAAPDAIILVNPADGSRVGGFATADGKYVLGDGTTPAPANLVPYKLPQIQGTADETGLGKTTENRVDQQLIDVAIAKDTAMTLRGMIEKSPASQGAVGWLRGTAQNVIATGDEIGNYFGGQIAEVTDAIASGAADADLAGAFDPSIPAIEMMANLLAFQYAKTTTGERLSNEMLKASRAALGLEGLTANQKSSLARIDMAIQQMESQQKILLGVKQSGTRSLDPAAGATDELTEEDLQYLGAP